MRKGLFDKLKYYLGMQETRQPTWSNASRKAQLPWQHQYETYDFNKVPDEFYRTTINPKKGEISEEMMKITGGLGLGGLGAIGALKAMNEDEKKKK